MRRRVVLAGAACSLLLPWAAESRWAVPPLAAWPDYRNDLYGLCSEAALLTLVAARTGGDARATPEQALALYARSSNGYRPGDESTYNNGTAWGSLKRVAAAGFEAGPRRVRAVLSDLPGFPGGRGRAAREAVEAACLESGGLILGLGLPEGTSVTGPRWPESKSGSSGGAHCVAMVGFTAGRLLLVSYASLVECDWDFFLAHADLASRIADLSFGENHERS